MNIPTIIACSTLFIAILVVLNHGSRINGLQKEIDELKQKNNISEKDNSIRYFLKSYTAEQCEIKKMQSEMQEELKRLEKCHIVKDNREFILLEDGSSETVLGTKYFVHGKEKCNTKRIKDVTLEELAQYVLDSKPIVREEMVSKEYKPQCDKIKAEINRK